MSQRRITLFIGSIGNTGGKLVLLPNDCELSELIELVQNKLSINTPITGIYTADNAEIDDPAVIRDNDTLYIKVADQNINTSAAAANNRITKTYSIAVMGPGSVGKSALTLRFVQGVFVRDYDPTIEDAYRKNCTVDNETCILDILDTAGQEDYSALRSTWMRDRDGFLLVYSITDRTSFDAIAPFYEQLLSMHEPTELDNNPLPPIILIGNKSDLSAKRVISTSDGEQRAAEYNSAIFYETSASTGQNVNEVFNRLIQLIRKKQRGTDGDSNKKKKSSWCSIL